MNVNERIAVTGANGYIGKHVVKKLLDMGYNVVALDINSDNIDGRAQIITESIFDMGQDVYSKIGCPERVIHLAWRDGFNHGSDAHMGDLSLHYELIKNLMNSGVKSISVMGSMHEIGYWEGAVDENTPTNPMSLYGIAKNALRQASKQLAGKYNTSLKWLRGFYIVGDDRSNHSIFSKIIEMEQKGEKEFPFTSGKNQYDFIDVDTLAEQIVKASVQDEIDGEINCCSGTPVSLGDKVEEFIAKNHYGIQLKYGAFPDRAYDSPAIWGNVDKIRKIMDNDKR